MVLSTLCECVGYWAREEAIRASKYATVFSQKLCLLSCYPTISGHRSQWLPFDLVPWFNFIIWEHGISNRASFLMHFSGLSGSFALAIGHFGLSMSCLSITHGLTKLS